MIKINIAKRIKIGTRKSQQDAVSYYASQDSPGVLLTLCDGMGGMENGEKYSNEAVHAMIELYPKLSGIPSEQKLRQLYEAARAAALKDEQDPENPSGGTTLLAVDVDKNNDTFAFVSVGDSRIYLYRGGLIQLNRTHVLGDKLDESVALGYIPSDVAKNPRLRSSLSNHLCDAAEKMPDIGAEPQKLIDGDVILLMSDGVFNSVSEAQMEVILNTPDSDAVKIANRIMNAVDRVGNPQQDNFSVVVMKVMRVQETKNDAKGRDGYQWLNTIMKKLGMGR